MTEATNNTNERPEYTQGICGDGAAILKDGTPMTIDEIVAELRTAPPAAAVVMPDVLAQCPKCPDGHNPDESYASGWNECLKYLRDTSRLNPAPVEQSAMVVPEGYALVPERMELLPEDIAVIMFHCGGDEDATEVDERFQGGVLWVGETRDDDGSTTYGLNIACVECLEEGSTPVVEFARYPATPAAPTPEPASPWISVEDRLPADPEWVLVFADGAINCMAWSDGHWEDWTEANMHNIFPLDITHWMPLPDAPALSAQREGGDA